MLERVITELEALQSDTPIKHRAAASIYPEGKHLYESQLAGYSRRRAKIAYTVTVPVCRGSFRALLLYDVAEEFDLVEMRKLIGGERPGRSPGFKLPAPDYVRFERPPVTEPCDPIQLTSGETANASLRYFEYGVISLEFDMPFETQWTDLIALSNRWIWAGEVERRGPKTIQARLARLQPAIRKAYTEWLDEAYYVIHLSEVIEEDGRHPTGSELISRYGRELSQVIRGENEPLSEVEQREVLASSLSYYPSDLLVLGWLAALVYDTPEGANPIIQLLEYANTQLLEYRRYDEILTTVLKRAYAVLEDRGRISSRWRLSREAAHLNQLRLDVTELTERADNAIKFLSDMYYARAYRLAAVKVGAGDYRSLVDQKLRTAGELYEFMVNEFREARSFLLEVLVIVILIIELIPIFRGR